MSQVSTVIASQDLEVFALLDQIAELTKQVTPLLRNAITEEMRRHRDTLARLRTTPEIEYACMFKDKAAANDAATTQEAATTASAPAARSEVTKEQFSQLGPKAWDDFVDAWNAAKASNAPFDAAKDKLAPYLEQLRAADFTSARLLRPNVSADARSADEKRAEDGYKAALSTLATQIATDPTLREALTVKDLSTVLPKQEAMPRIAYPCTLTRAEFKQRFYDKLRAQRGEIIPFE